MNQKKHTVTLDGMTWLSLTRYGEFFGKPRQSVYQLKEDGNIRKRKYDGHVYVSGFPPASWSVLPEFQDEWNRITETWIAVMPATENAASKPKKPRRPPDLNFEKARKMAAEAELAELKLEEKKGEMARNTAEMVIEVFRDSFASVIDHLYELDLNKTQLTKLRSMYRAALDDMKRRLDKLGINGTAQDDEEDE